jgi:hypothetical protein
MLGDPFRRGGGVEGEGLFVTHDARVTRNSRALQITGGCATNSA